MAFLDRWFGEAKTKYQKGSDHSVRFVYLGVQLRQLGQIHYKEELSNAGESLR